MDVSSLDKCYGWQMNRPWRGKKVVCICGSLTCRRELNAEHAIAFLVWHRQRLIGALHGGSIDSASQRSTAKHGRG